MSGAARVLVFADRWALTAPMLAEVLSVTPATAYRWMHGGRVCPTAVFCMDLIDEVSMLDPGVGSDLVWRAKKVSVMAKAQRRADRRAEKERALLKAKLYKGEI